jgi:hypothetical protein
MPHSSVVDRPSLPALLTATSSQPKRFDGRIDERTHIVLVARIGGTNGASPRFPADRSSPLGARRRRPTSSKLISLAIMTAG